MRYSDSTTISVSPHQAFNVLRDHIEDLIPLLPNVDSTTVLKRFERADGSFLIVRRFQGSAKQVPRCFRPFVSKEALAWTDTSIWDPHTLTCRWTVENIHSGYAVCRGLNHFRPAPEGVSVELTGEFTVDGNNIPKVPKMIGRRLAKRAEKLVVGHTVSNFREMVIGIEQLLGEVETRVAA